MFFYEFLDNQNRKGCIAQTKLFVVQFVDFESLQVRSYTQWKLGFLTSLKTSLKQVFQEKLLYMENEKSKLSKTYCIRKKMKQSVYYMNLRFNSKKLDTWQVVHFHSPERAKNYKCGKIATNFYRNIEIRSTCDIEEKTYQDTTKKISNLEEP